MGLFLPELLDCALSQLGRAWLNLAGFPVRESDVDLLLWAVQELLVLLAKE